MVPMPMAEHGAVWHPGGRQALLCPQSFKEFFRVGRRSARVYHKGPILPEYDAKYGPVAAVVGQGVENGRRRIVRRRHAE